jgi:predicted alpha/beta-hydrolase family hydrolase
VTDAVVIPGRMYGPEAPLLKYAADVAERRGAKVYRHSWREDPPPDGSGTEAWVRAEVSAALDAVGGEPLLIGKSLGTLGASLAAERALPAVWLTPLLILPPAVAALERATAPFLLIGGTADEAWDTTAAHRLTPHVLEVPDADHGMYVPGPLTDTIAVLSRVVTAIEEFLAAIDWPS